MLLKGPERLRRPERIYSGVGVGQTDQDKNEIGIDFEECYFGDPRGTEFGEPRDTYFGDSRAEDFEFGEPTATELDLGEPIATVMECVGLDFAEKAGEPTLKDSISMA